MYQMRRTLSTTAAVLQRVLTSQDYLHALDAKTLVCPRLLNMLDDSEASQSSSDLAKKFALYYDAHMQEPKPAKTVLAEMLGSDPNAPEEAVGGGFGVGLFGNTGPGLTYQFEKYRQSHDQDSNNLLRAHVAAQQGFYQTTTGHYYPLKQAQKINRIAWEVEMIEDEMKRRSGRCTII